MPLANTSQGSQVVRRQAHNLKSGGAIPPPASTLASLYHVAKSIPIETDRLCHYGCGCRALYQTKGGSLICCPSPNSCPELRKRNSEGLSKAYGDGKRASGGERYHSLPEHVKQKMAWNKGLTKESNSSVKSYSDKLRGRPNHFRGKTHTAEARAKISQARTAWLKRSENRVNLGRHKKSWMESTFEAYLLQNSVTNFEMEKHFWSEPLGKNFYADFLFEDKKLIIELDGTQHLGTADKDLVRDQWFMSIGYTVVRVDVKEFKKRYFSGTGFLDILGC